MHHVHGLEEVRFPPHHLLLAEAQQNVFVRLDVGIEFAELGSAVHSGQIIVIVRICADSLQFVQIVEIALVDQAHLADEREVLVDVGVCVELERIARHRQVVLGTLVRPPEVVLQRVLHVHRVRSADVAVKLGVGCMRCSRAERYRSDQRSACTPADRGSDNI